VIDFLAYLLYIAIFSYLTNRLDLLPNKSLAESSYLAAALRLKMLERPKGIPALLCAQLARKLRISSQSLFGNMSSIRHRLERNEARTQFNIQVNIENKLTDSSRSGHRELLRIISL